MEQPRIDRLLRLISLMLSCRRYTVAQLGEKVGLNKRSIYRYIQSFKDVGVGVDCQGQCYSLSRDRGFIKDLIQNVSFTDEEAQIFYRMIMGLDENSPMKLSLKVKLESIYRCAALAEMVDDQNLGRNINTLCDAIRQHHQVILKGYKSGNSNIESDRLVEPFGFMNGYIGVWAYDIQQSSTRIFKIKRIEQVIELEHEWEYEEMHVKEYQDIFHFSGHIRRRVKLRLGIKAHNVILEEYPLSEKYMIPADDNHWILDFEVASYKGACRFVLGMIDDIEIIDSPEFEEYVYDFVRKNLNIDRLRN